MSGFTAYLLLTASGRCLTKGQGTTARLVAHTQAENGMIRKCDTSMDGYCLNGECMLIVDLNEHHCRCHRGYEGSRCALLAMVHKPMRQEYIILTVVCVVLVTVGMAGAVYLIFKWYRKNRCSPVEKKYQEVQMV